MKNSLKIEEKNYDIAMLSKAAWQSMAPFWPLENLIACNPLQGFENLPFSEALAKASIYFEQENLPPEIEEINRQTIKWCQAFFDQCQSTIKMPNRYLGFYGAWLKLAKFDGKLHKNSAAKIKQISLMPLSAEDAISECLSALSIPQNEQEKFLTLILATMPGWAAHVKYLGEWKCKEKKFDSNQIDYLAVRLATTLLIWPEAKNLILWHEKRKLNNCIRPASEMLPSLADFGFEDQLAYAKGSLTTMGLTSNFVPIVVLCGHGSATENNAYASALDCGACGGRHGGGNAKILATILNSQKVRQGLSGQGILIPAKTRFIAAQHNTTTDDIEIYAQEGVASLEKLKLDLKAAQQSNNKWRSNKMGHDFSEKKSVSHAQKCSVNWAETRPEWGLARNASFIVAKRDLTKNIDLDGRSFLHSYDWQQDVDGSALNLILTAPMVVAQWINTQYLFSTINNVAYGSGSKITQNIVGKIGVMQGNGSDLMHGLPLQSVFSCDSEAYHQPIRLTTFIHAPTNLVDKAIYKNEILQKLFSNAWVHVLCLDPRSEKLYSLQQELIWKEYQQTES